MFRNKLILVVGAFFMLGIFFSTLGIKAWFIIKEREKHKVSEKKLVESEQTLKESEERFRIITETVPALVCITRLEDSIVLFTNEYNNKAFGMRGEEILGTKGPDYYFDPDDRAKMVKIFKEQGLVNNHPLKVKKNDGTPFWIITSVRPIMYNGYPAIIGASIDITEHKKVEEALKNSERNLSDIYSSMTEGLALHEIIYDDSGKAIDYMVIEVNPAYEKITGIKRSNVIGNKATKVYATEMAPYIDIYNQVASSGLSTTFETYFPPMDIYFSISVFSPGKGKFATVFQDITKRRKAENALHEAQGKLNIALENANIGIWEWDLKTDKVKLDERLEKMFGIKFNKAGITYAEFEDLINEEDILHLQTSIRNALDSDLRLETIFRPKSKNGETKYFSTKALVNKDKDGKPANFTGVCFDITAMREGTEQVVIKLNEELLRSNKELESFAYIVSHDLQEPLRMVSSFTQMLAQRYKDQLDQNAQDYIHFAVDGTKRMQDLINGLLAYSRIQTKSREFSHVNLSQIVEDVKHNLSLKLKGKNIQLSVETLPEIMGDAGQMLQLMQNLVGNAVKFSKDNTCVHIASKFDRDFHTISVKDDGIGIESKYFEKIFQIFQRLVEKDEYEGTGIGLAICKRIVEHHGGRIWVESEMGKGSTFYFSVPKEVSKVS